MRYYELLEDATFSGWLYHGTTTAILEGIRINGLVPYPLTVNPEKTGVYLSDDYHTASEYAFLATDRRGGEECVVAVQAKYLNLSKLLSDDEDIEQFISDAKSGDEIGYLRGVPPVPEMAQYDSWTEVPWQVSLRICNQVIYPERIPVRFLRQIENQGGKLSASPIS